MQAVAADLPDSCPPADSPEVRSVNGEVSHARGGPEFQFSYTWHRDNKLDSQT